LCYADSSEVLRLGRREEREAQGGARHRLEDVVFHIKRGDLLDILEHPNPDRYAGPRIFVVRREDYVYLMPFPPSPASAPRGLRRGLAVALRAEADVEDADGLPEDHHSESEGYEAVLVEESDDHEA
jgi:hypothetical protein